LTAPSAPTIFNAVPGNTQAAINFAPPSSNGGAVISGYTATCLPGPIIATGLSSPIIVTSLTNNTPYTCTVTASNSAGTGGASASAAVTPSASPLFALFAVKSRKTHGGAGPFELVVDTQPANGAVTVEPRAIGSGHAIVFQFNGAVASLGSANVTPVGNVSAAVAGNEIVVTLTGVPDNQRVAITLGNVNGSVNPSPLSMGFMLGDVNNSRSINASDISGLKTKVGQSTSATNFRFDLNASGNINAADLSMVKARSGSILP
jgi:hypothetical protein